MVKFFKKTLRFFLYAFLVICFLAIMLFDKVDRTPYRNTVFYKQTMERVNQLTGLPLEEDYEFRAGWAKRNITPDYPKTFSGYGLRKAYQGVSDSIYVRTLVFDDGFHQAAIVSFDLLIAPPEIVEKVKQLLPSTGMQIDQIYYSATHTHSSVGGWARNMGGVAIAGFYDEEYVKLIAQKVIEAIAQSVTELEPAQLGFARYNSGGVVYNRLVGDEGKVDPWLKVLKVQKESGATAVMSVFSAHATCIGKKNELLSRDYPGALVDTLEQSPHIDFAMFCAGAVGSHGPAHIGNDMFHKLTLVADSLSSKIIQGLDAIKMEKELPLKTYSIPISLREPHFKIHPEWRLRPWVFYSLMGKYDAGINVLRIGDNVLVGTPCDFSGELSLGLDELARDANLNLMITSFNGGYIGYVTEDSHYDLPKEETQAMNWYGPFNGAYFSEVIQELIKKI
jgi:neutral ceramidase